MSDDFFQNYFDYVESNTESPLIFHRWAAMSAISSALGRRLYFKHGHRKIYPNQFIMLIGGPATRKSSAIDIAQNLLYASGYNMFAATRTSKEKFLADLAVGYGKQRSEIEEFKGKSAFAMLAEMDSKSHNSPREVTICSGEFNTFIGHNNPEFAGILGDLWDNKNTFEVTNRTTSSSFIHEPTVNILGGNTQQGFSNAFPPEIIGQGFLSRLILVNSEDAKKIAFPEDPDPNLEKVLVNHLAEMQTLEGEVTMTAEAKELLTLLYESPPMLDDFRFVYYNGRRFTHTLKLCVVCAAARGSMVMDVSDVIYANSILSYAELQMPKALGEFGKAKLADLNNKIMNCLYDNPNGHTTLELFKMLHNDCNKMTELVEVLQNLKMAEKIDTALGGRHRAKPKKALDNGMMDFKLLREYVEPKNVVAKMPLKQVVK